MLRKAPKIPKHIKKKAIQVHPYVDITTTVAGLEKAIKSEEENNARLQKAIFDLSDEETELKLKQQLQSLSLEKPLSINSSSDKGFLKIQEVPSGIQGESNIYESSILERQKFMGKLKTELEFLTSIAKNIPSPSSIIPVDPVPTFNPKINLTPSQCKQISAQLNRILKKYQLLVKVNDNLQHNSIAVPEYRAEIEKINNESSSDPKIYSNDEILTVLKKLAPKLETLTSMA